MQPFAQCPNANPSMNDAMPKSSIVSQSSIVIHQSTMDAADAAIYLMASFTAA
jgi:hypothetical protein